MCQSEIVIYMIICHIYMIICDLIGRPTLAAYRTQSGSPKSKIWSSMQIPGRVYARKPKSLHWKAAESARLAWRNWRQKGMAKTGASLKKQKGKFPSTFSSSTLKACWLMPLASRMGLPSLFSCLPVNHPGKPRIVPHSSPKHFVHAYN